jgi:hypothetical protein
MARYCQSHSFLFLTANRNQNDPDSLEQALRGENREDALPVVTLSDPQRLIEPVYRERCIHYTPSRVRENPFVRLELL